MKSIKELIREYPELGDAFADFENRISFLENSIGAAAPISPDPTKEIIKVTKVQVNDLQLSQLRRNLVLYIDKKLKDLSTKKVDKQYTIINK